MISLILCTKGRLEEPILFVKSVGNPKPTEVELIVIDQNNDDVLKQEIMKIVRSQQYNVKYVKSKASSLSMARNEGLRLATGEITGFPDDDCTYDSGVIQAIIKCDFRKIKCWIGNDINQHRKLPPVISISKIFGSVISYTIFIETKIAQNLMFDEDFGVGARFGSAEETDFIYRYLISYGEAGTCTNAIIYHPVRNTNLEADRVFKYAKGTGAFFRKNILGLTNPRLLLRFSFAFLGPLFKIFHSSLTNNRTKKLENYSMLKGRLIGFITYRKSKI